MDHIPTVRATNLLEATLRFWEDSYLMGEISERSINAQVSGVHKHWSEFRPYLLSLREGEFDQARFAVSPGTPEVSSMRGFSRHLAAWTAGSRRIFSLPNELWEEFWTTDYGGLRWEQLLWPFESFIIALDPPLQVSEDVEVTMLMVSMMQGKFKPYPDEDADNIEVFTLGQDPKRADKLDKHLSSEHRKRMISFLHAGRIKAAAKMFNRVGDPKRMKGDDPCFTFPVRIKKEGLVEEHGNANALAIQLRRVLAGFCLYMENLPSGALGTTKEGWGDASTANVRNVITSRLDVCDVRKLHTLSPETLITFSQKKALLASRTVEPHARRGYWRKRRGQGNNPLAPKEIEVKPTWIHRDKCPEGTMPGGATSVLK